VKGVSGTWKDLTDNVNFMASNLTDQVRGIAKVVTAVANGDLKRKLFLRRPLGATLLTLGETSSSVRLIDRLASSAMSPYGFEEKLAFSIAVATAVTTFAMPRTWS